MRKPTPDRIHVTTFCDGTAAYATTDDQVLASVDAGSQRKSLKLLRQMLNQMDSETHWSLKYQITHDGEKH